MQSINDEMASSCPETTQPKSKKRTKHLPPQRVQRSRSCSSIYRKPKDQDENGQTVIPELEQLEEEEVDGNELVELLKSKLVLRSPKLNLTQISTTHTGFGQTMHTGENLSITTDEKSQVHTGEISDTFSNLDPTSPTKLLDYESENDSQTPTSSLLAEIKGFIRESMRQQKNHFENQLKMQQQIQQRQLQQMKSQIQQNLQQQILKLSEQPSTNIQEETISAPCKPVNTNRQRQIKALKPKNSDNSTPYIKTKSIKPADSKQTANATVVSIPTPTTGLTSKALKVPTLFPPPPESKPNTHENKPRTIDAMLLGSSIVKHVKGRAIKRKSGKYVKVCSFPGADTEKVCDHTEVELKYATPATAIIHAGGNDLAYGTSAEEAVDNIAYLGCELKDRGVKNIAISAMVPRYRLKNDIKHINVLLKGMCKSYQFDFISHHNIFYNNHICQDGVHLNYDGVGVLQSNYARYLRKLGNEE